MRTSMAVLIAVGIFLMAGACSAAPASGRDEVAEGAKNIGHGIEQTAKGVGATIATAAKQAGERLRQAGKRAKPVADKLHDRARDFGSALYDGLKYVGHTLSNFFTGAAAAGREKSRTPSRASNAPAEQGPTRR